LLDILSSEICASSVDPETLYKSPPPPPEGESVPNPWEPVDVVDDVDMRSFGNALESRPYGLEKVNSSYCPSGFNRLADLPPASCGGVQSVMDCTGLALGPSYLADRTTSVWRPYTVDPCNLTASRGKFRVCLRGFARLLGVQLRPPREVDMLRFSQHSRRLTLARCRVWLLGSVLCPSTESYGALPYSERPLTGPELAAVSWWLTNRVVRI